MSHRLVIAPDFPPNLFSGWYTLNTLLQKRSNLAVHLETPASSSEQSLMIAKGDIDLVYANPFDAAELIREKILTQTEDEVPHAAAVLIENKEFKKDKVYIQAMILVERDSQKGIMIGKQGQMLKKIGSLAREDIEKLLGKKVFLELFVRVENEWRSRDARITEYGYGGASRDE